MQEIAELQDTKRELHHFRRRLAVLGAVTIGCFGILIGRLVWLQVIKHDNYIAQAEDNRIAIVPIVPVRGQIFDRNGVELARNVASYALQITPSKLQYSADSVIDELGKLIEVTPRDRRRFKRLMAESRKFESLPLVTRLSEEDVARFAAQSFRFPGVKVEGRLQRQYPMGELGAHILGFIGRINQREADAIDAGDNASNYAGTDHIGKEGLEKSYEAQLHGTTGHQEVEVTAGGQAVRTLSRLNPVPGKNLILSIDIELQKVVEQAFGDQRGAMVAIDPATGDILAYVSKPGYDPNLFVDGIDQESWDALNTSIDRPMVNRPLSGTYAPGSTFKPFMALAALELGVRTPEAITHDPGFLMVGTHKFRDDKVHGSVNLHKSIVTSCNTYYYQLGTEITIDTINGFMKPYGFGELTGIDLENESRGVLPSRQWKRSRFKDPAQQRWFTGDTVSVANGSGYNSYTPLQIAHAVANLANDGVVMKPHLVKTIEDAQSGERTPTVPKESYRIAVSQRNIDLVKRAMVGVTSEEGGTALKAFANAGYTVGGKTGTAQVVGIRKNERYNAKLLAERLRDNSLFTAFAPAEQPRIALAVVVENGGWGGGIAAEVARKALDYYLLGKRDGKEAATVNNEIPAEAEHEMAPKGEPESVGWVSAERVTQR